VHVSRREAIENAGFRTRKNTKNLSKKLKNLLHSFAPCNILKKLANKTALRAVLSAFGRDARGGMRRNGSPAYAMRQKVAALSGNFC
jgi:hypothetical protein